MVEEKVVVGKVAKRFVPLLVASAFLCYLDRVNVSFAAITMNADLGLSAAAYGFGAGVFFLTYVLLEVPSNIILERVGARLWLARIMFTWGLISFAMVFVRGEYSFYAMRALLGIAEAGFYPGVVFYLSQWFPGKYRARIYSFFWLSIPLSTVIGAPLSGLLLGLDGLLGLKGWMWLFMLEAIPTMLMAFVLLRVITDRPSEATWLAPAERDWLVQRMADERAASTAGGSHSAVDALKNPKVLALGFICFGAVISNYGVNFFLPQIVKGFGLSNTAVGFVSALPSVAAIPGILLFGYISDRTQNRRGCVAFGIAAVGVCLTVSTFLDGPVSKMAALTAAGFFMFGYLSPFWSIPPYFLKGPALAAGIAAINSIANVAGFVGPYLMGYLREQTGSFEGGLRAIAAIGTASIVLLLLVRPKREEAWKAAPAKSEVAA